MAKNALAGRADEIEHVEHLLDGMRTAYMSSLAMAQAAKTDAMEATAREMEKSRAEAGRLHEDIATLKKQLADAAATAAELDELRATISDVEARADRANAAREAAEAERSELSAIFQRQIREAEGRAEALAAEVAEARAVKSQAEALAGELATARADAEANAKRINELEADAQATAKKHQTEIDQLNGRFAERMEIAAARAENEKSQAVLIARTEAARELDAVRRELAEFIAGMKPKTTNRKGNKKNERNATMESTTAE